MNAQAYTRAATDGTLDSRAPERFDFEAIGTLWQIETPAGSPLPESLRQAIARRIEEFDAVYSRFRADSLVAILAREPGRVEFPADSLELFALYDRLVAATSGAVDPLVGRSLELLGYDASYSLTPSQPTVAEQAMQDERGRASWFTDVRRHGRIVETTRPVVIDVGAAGKGYLVDIVSALLVEHGLTEFVVDGSGDLRHRGPADAPGVRIGLEHPLQPGKAIGVATLANAALCASASNRRAWGDGQHHILDARSGNPAREVIATWVVAADTALADGLATALFFTGAHELAKTFHFSYVRMYADGRAERSRDFPGELFS
ncbi:FAD:protein FMN transferase [Herbiconiux sp. KACC 21604]|uniref:FAD:protein FMN transferase n=1 Tax=unclassified Herbiconiux TaxID=2618217 RepID=UPI001491EE58|nr:FAD:protein FMN transferase [Herbiconiux sp. SALV-R1]QJU55824.1 FAD:protein FMN transferase [Herbiconiux sp. SALV-R1]WPO87038.1 FAD:protein FMN transferase [Herbiconiux sp. KACC 21604]